MLLIDGEGQGLDLAYRAGEAGHTVRWYRMSDKPVKDGEGFPGIKLVDGWKEHMSWAKSGVIITTGNHKLMKELDRYREYGFPLFTPSSASAQLEINRKTGMDLMQKHDLNICPYKMFDSLQGAIDHVVKTDETYVFKTMGDEEDKSLSYVGCSPEDLVSWLEKRLSEGLKLKGRCMLQEKMEPVAEVGIAAWIGPAGFLPYWEVSFEHKRLMPGHFGPNTGEMGTVCQYVDADPLVDVLRSFESDLVKLGHVGDIAINGGIDSKGAYWPFEWTARLGWPDMFIRMAMHRGDPVQWMRDLCDGKDTLKVSNDTAIGVLVAQPPFPTKVEDQEQVEGNRIDGLKDIWDQVHPIGMMIADGPKIVDGSLEQQDTFYTTSEYVMCVTGTGKTVQAANKSVYRAIKDIKLANMIVRDDIGETVMEGLPKLHELGYCLGVDF